MMTRKHYEEMANILALLRENLNEAQQRGDLYMEVDSAFSKTVQEICSFFLSDNPRFNNKKFVDVVFNR